MEKQLIEFINKAHTTFQAVDEAEKLLKKANYIELSFNDTWRLEKGQKYYIKKNGSSIIAFNIGKNISVPAIHIVASHNDSPMLKIKPEGLIINEHYTKINTEVYGGLILSTFVDRPLGIAGRVVVEENSELVIKNIQLDTTVIIPNLAIHMNRDMNNNYSLNPQIDMQAILSLNKLTLSELISPLVNQAKIIDYELYLYNKEEAMLAGANNELIVGPRLDDLECYYTSLQALINIENTDNISMWFGFNNEEVGSESNNAAASTFCVDVVEAMLDCLNLGLDKLKIYHKSMIVSADNAHAVHPNHPEKSDPVNQVFLNKGVVIKYNANLNYTTDAISGSIFKQLCNQENIPYQVYTNRSDIRGGGTLGRILLAKLSFYSVDIGLAQLAMHSSFETAGTKDLQYLYQALSKFYSFKIKIND